MATRVSGTNSRPSPAALAIAAADGYAAVSMRSIAARLDTGQSSLYPHVANKFELDRLLVARLWAGIHVPDPDPARWRDQLVDVYLQQAELFVRHPGIEGAYHVSAPTDPQMLEFIERTLALYEAGGFTGESCRQLEATLEAMTIALIPLCTPAGRPIRRTRSANGDSTLSRTWPGAGSSHRGGRRFLSPRGHRESAASTASSRG